MNVLKWFFALAAALFSIQESTAQTFPNKPVQVVISFTPGSATDIMARIMVGKLGEDLGRTRRCT